MACPWFGCTNWIHACGQPRFTQQHIFMACECQTSCLCYLFFCSARCLRNIKHRGIRITQAIMRRLLAMIYHVIKNMHHNETTIPKLIQWYVQQRSKQYNGIWGKIVPYLGRLLHRTTRGHVRRWRYPLPLELCESYAMPATASSSVQPSRMAHSDIGTESGTPGDLFLAQVGRMMRRRSLDQMCPSPCSRPLSLQPPFCNFPDALSGTCSLQAMFSAL